MRSKIFPVLSGAVLLLAGIYWFGLPRIKARSSASQKSVAAIQNQTTQDLDQIVATYRKIIVLMEDTGSLDEMNRERVTTVGRVLFQQNQDRLSALSESLSDELAKSSFPAVEAFLDRVENNPDYHDADKLVFRDVLDDLAATMAQRASVAALQKRITEDIAALDEIQALYQKEIDQTFSNLQSRGMPVRREAWERYLASIKQKYQREQILKENEGVLPASESRGGAKKKDMHGQMFGGDLPPKTLLLTFDDGPHPRYTDRVLEILKKYQMQAVFFQVGKNLGTLGSGGEVKLAPASAASYRILEAGSAIGNHSYSHPVLPKLDETGYTKEIESTNKLLRYILKVNPVLFRPPYGASNDGILTLAQTDQLKTMIWNIDSMDWADPVPNSITQRVLGEVEHEGHGIILFHDIHKRTLDVLPQLIEALQAKGYHFASWSGSGFATTESRGVQTAAAPAPVEPPYRESWAAVMGIDEYQNWPKLRYAANDAQGVRDVLIQKYQFKPQNVFLLLNKDATRQNILSLLGDKLGNADLIKREDRVFVFFAGHGATRKLPSGRDLGYIIPVDADLSNYEGQAISMTNFQDISESIPAKHVLFIMDSCYSGLALTRGGGMQVSQNYLREIARREARQMFTAGGADQQVADNGPNGHSVFTWTLLQALDGRGDLNGDGVITASELAAYVTPAVSTLSHQTPAFGNLSGSEGGDFIFDLKHESEFLSDTSAQLGDDAIKLNAEVEQLRAENLKMKQELAAAESMLRGKKMPASRGGSPADRALALNDDGMRLYKERKYAEAANKFTEASGLDPTSALIANNAGFALHKSGEYEDAVRWFEKAIQLDPRRAVAYLNLGDADVKLKRDAQAKQAYQKFLELAPASRSAPEVKEKLKALEQ